MNRIAIVDIDGCLCPSIFANIKHNDNSKLLSPEFEKDLAEVEPFQWALDWDWSKNNYTNIIVITGRMGSHNYITHEWLSKLFGRPFELINVEWNDSYPSREESYRDYVSRKTRSIIYFLEQNGTADHADILEDDRKVLKGMHAFCGILDFANITLYLVKDGILGEIDIF